MIYSINKEHAGCYLLVDTETTGFIPEQNQLIQLGAVVLDENLSPVSAYETLIKYDKYIIIEQAMKQNRLSLDSVQKNGLSVEEATTSFLSFLERNIYVDEAGKSKKLIFTGQNCDFDISFVEKLFEKDVDKFAEYRNYVSHYKFDLMQLALIATIKKERSFDRYNLDAISAVLGITPSGRHTALGDCFTEMRCIQTLVGAKVSSDDDISLLQTAENVEKSTVADSQLQTMICNMAMLCKIEYDRKLKEEEMLKRLQNEKMFRAVQTYCNAVGTAVDDDICFEMVDIGGSVCWLPNRKVTPQMQKGIVKGLQELKEQKNTTATTRNEGVVLTQ